MNICCKLKQISFEIPYRA